MDNISIHLNFRSPNVNVNLTFKPSVQQLWTHIFVKSAVQTVQVSQQWQFEFFLFFFLVMSLGSSLLMLTAHRATTVLCGLCSWKARPALETVRIEPLDPHMAAVSWVICEAQWQAANIKVFISFPQFTIYSAWLTSQLPFSTTTKYQFCVCEWTGWRTFRWVVSGWLNRWQKI